MVLKFYGNFRSPFAKTVAMVLYEKRIPFGYIEIDLQSGQNRTPEYLAIQPFGQVPCIDHDGFILFESRAICRYLEETYPNQGTRLIPPDPKKRALFDQAASIEIFSFDRFVTPLTYEYWYKKPEERDTQRIRVLTEGLCAKLDVYDQVLSKQKYVAGDELTLADLYHIPVGCLLFDARPDLFQGRPNLVRWYNEISARASWQKTKEGLDTSTVESTNMCIEKS